MELSVIDFQLCRRARPVLDLAYFFNTSSSPEFRRLYRAERLNYYYSLLADALKKLGYSPDEVYPKQTFEDDFYECEPFGFQIGRLHSMVKISFWERYPYIIFHT
jgi:signal recognition particle subunit SEC65